MDQQERLLAVRDRFYSGPGTMPKWRAEQWRAILATLEGVPEEQTARITLKVHEAMERAFQEGAVAAHA